MVRRRQSSNVDERAGITNDFGVSKIGIQSL